MCKPNWRVTHGESWPCTPRYAAWVSMLDRCRNPNNRRWKDYGGRGIRVCERWHVFENFRDDVGPHPGKGWSLDRPKNDEDYGPDNWQWATPEMQRHNQRRTKLTYELVDEIRKRAVEGGTQKSLGQLFGVSREIIGRILRRQIWIKGEDHQASLAVRPVEKA